MRSGQAVEEPGAPEAGPAGHLLEITVLFEVLLRDVVAEREAAIEAEREAVAEHAFPEGPVPGIVPDGADVALPQRADDPRLDSLCDAAAG